MQDRAPLVQSPLRAHPRQENRTPRVRRDARFGRLVVGVGFLFFWWLPAHTVAGRDRPPRAPIVTNCDPSDSEFEVRRLKFKDGKIVSSLGCAGGEKSSWGGTRLGGTCGGCGKWTTNPDESQHLQLEGARARQGRRGCCRSTDVEEFDHRGSRVAATAAHRGGARCESRDSAMGRPSLCTSVTVVGLNLAAPN
eukprot:scaffold4116_cov106-Isochrysis_galbana.AAC.7